MEANLSGDNFIQVQNGNADVKGSLSAKNIELIAGWKINEIKLTLNTIANTIGGDVQITFPFGVKAPPRNLAERVLQEDQEIGVGLGAEFVIDPTQLNRISGMVSFSPGVSIGTTGAFLQSIQGSINNLAESIPDPIELMGGVGFTAGPMVLGTSLLDVNLSATVSSQQISGQGKVTIINDLIANGQGTTTLNFNEKTLYSNSMWSILDGSIQGQSDFKANARFNINMANQASVNIPNFIPFYGGQQIGSGNFLLDFSNDNNLSNDFAAGWGTLNISIPSGGEISIVQGFKGFFDGRFELFGVKGVPPTGSFLVEPNTEYLLLGADWENEVTGDVPLIVETPDGRFLTEPEFAANNIAIVDELTDSTTKVAIVVNPTPGIWDVNVADSTGLGAVEFSAARDSVAPTISIANPAIDVVGGEVAIDYSAFDADSDAEVKLFYDTDSEGFDGVLLADGLQETDGEGSFVWDTEGVPTGEYHIYAMILDENNPPAFSYSPGRVQITEASDLVVNQTTNLETAGAGTNLVYTVEVTNNSSEDAKGVRLTNTLPEGVTLVSTSIAPTSQVGNELVFDLGDFDEGESQTIEITVLPQTLGTITNTTRVLSRTFDPDATNDVDVLTTDVEETAIAAPPGEPDDDMETVSDPPESEPDDDIEVVSDPPETEEPLDPKFLKFLEIYGLSPEEVRV